MDIPHALQHIPQEVAKAFCAKPVSYRALPFTDSRIIIRWMVLMPPLVSAFVQIMLRDKTRSTRMQRWTVLLRASNIFEGERQDAAHARRSQSWKIVG